MSKEYLSALIAAPILQPMMFHMGGEQ
jgi:hypothetical protein